MVLVARAGPLDVLEIALPRILHWGTVVAISAAFSVWFSFKQASFAGPGFAENVPLREHAPTVVVVCMTMLSLYLLLPGSVRRPFPAGRVMGFAFGVALAVFASLMTGVLVYVALWGAFWLASNPPGRLRRVLIERIAPFAAIAASYTIFLPSVSPFYTYHAASRSYETYLSASSLAIRNYVAAHYFSFSPFTHTFWGMIQDMPTGLTSVVLAFFGLLDVFSLWEASSFFKLLSLIFFATYVFAGFFLFLMLRELQVRWSIALATALVLFIGNQFYLNMVNQDMGWAGASFMGMTASLWLLVAAVRRDSLMLGGWSGIALASPFYVIAPHPEMVIYSVVIYILLALSIVACNPASTRTRAFTICVVSGAVSALSSLAYMVPILSQVVSGSTVVLGEDTTIPQSFAFQVPGLSFYLFLLTACTVLELLRCRKYGRLSPALPAFLLVAVPILLLAVPGVPTGVHDFFIRFGWTVHLQPFDRLLAYVGFSSLVIAAVGLEAAIALVPPAQVKRLMLNLVKEHRPFAGSKAVNLAELAAFVILVAWLPWMIGSKPSVTVIDGSLNGIRESLQAILANTLSEADQRNSVPFLRERLLDFENRSVSWDIPGIAAVRGEYDAALAVRGVKSVRQLPPEKVREFAYTVAERIDASYASVDWLDGIPENVDGYLAGLDDPYVRVMAVLGEHDLDRQLHQRAFISVARNVVSAHNNSMMMDTRAYVGYPSVQALYIYPRDFLPNYRPIIQQGNYFISGERPPWHYETGDVLGNEFRKLLGIAGVGAYLMLPEKGVFEALQRPNENLKRLSWRTAGKETMILVRDGNAYDTAYLARVVATVPSEKIDGLGSASRKFFTRRIGLAEFRKVMDPAADALLGMPKRHDAILEQGRDPAVDNAVTPGIASEGPEARGGKVEIKGAIGPRIGLQVRCPDPHCVAVYNLAALPGWRAYVDGEARPIVRANYGFISVNVPQGVHFVSLFYETPGQSFSECASLLTLIVMLGLTRREKERRRPV